VFASGSTEPVASGQLNFVDSSVDPATGTIMAKATFANEDLSLWPGQYVDVEIDLDARPNVLSIPTVALQTGQKGPFVFVAKPDGTAEQRTVETGSVVGDRTAVRSGLKAGERVVVEGQIRLANGAHVRDQSQTPEQPAQQNEKAAPKAPPKAEPKAPPPAQPNAKNSRKESNKDAPRKDVPGKDVPGKDVPGKDLPRKDAAR
jgi:multidrug efflux system membrane fusion protein